MTPDTKLTTKTLSAADVLNGKSPCVLTAMLAPVAGLDRFQPAGFPEVGHVTYKAPRKNGAVEDVCIVDSAASMANHLESVCMRGPHDYDLAADLSGMPYLRCVTSPEEPDPENQDRREVVVTSLTEGHRIASTYFLDGKRTNGSDLASGQFKDDLADQCGIILRAGNRAHPPVEKWWQVFSTIFKYDPNTLVHGVLFPKWNIRIPRVLTAHLEAIGAGRVDRSGVKFDRLQKTTSGQPIFAVDESTAREIRATFILDVALLRSFGRADGQKNRGLTQDQKEFLLSLALWKIRALLAEPFRFRSGCHLQLVSLKHGESETQIDVNMKTAIEKALFRSGDAATEPVVTDLFWPRTDLYDEPAERTIVPKDNQDDGEEEEEPEGE